MTAIDAITFSHLVTFINIAHVCIVVLDYLGLQNITQFDLYQKFSSAVNGSDVPPSL